MRIIKKDELNAQLDWFWFTLGALEVNGRLGGQKEITLEEKPAVIKALQDPEIASWGKGPYEDGVHFMLKRITDQVDEAMIAAGRNDADSMALAREQVFRKFDVTQQVKFHI